MFSLGKKKKGFRFDIDEQVEYIGELKSKKGRGTSIAIDIPLEQQPTT